MGWWMVGLKAIFWRGAEWFSFSDSQTHVQGVKNATSGTFAVIHRLTHL